MKLDIPKRELPPDKLPGIDLNLNALGLEPGLRSALHLREDPFQNEQVREAQPDISDLYLGTQLPFQGLLDAIRAEEERQKKVKMRAKNEGEEEEPSKNSSLFYSCCRMV